MFHTLQHTINRLTHRIPREVLENGWSLFVALLAIALLLFMGSCENKGKTTNPEIKPLMEAVYASGFVRAQGEYEVFSEGEGYVLEKLVSDGQAVHKGDPLFILQAHQQTARFQIANRNFNQASANAKYNSPLLNELRSALNSSKAKMEFDSINYIRYKNLLESKAAKRIDYETRRLAYENSMNEYLFYKNRYQRTIDDLKVVHENARQQLLIASDDSGKNIIRSLMDGRVFQTKKDKGELVRRGESVALLGKNDAVYLELNVDELDIDKLKVGQTILVKADAFSDQVFHGVVTKIYPLIDVRQQSLRVDANFTDSIPSFFSGLAVEANIVIQQKQNALVIPKAALLRGDSLWIERDGTQLKIKIQKGIETLDEVEILDGLDTTTTLLIKQ